MNKILIERQTGRMKKPQSWGHQTRLYVLGLILTETLEIIFNVFES